jgi:hypothetical protein
VVDAQGNRTYQTTKLKPFVDPLLKEMGLEVGTKIRIEAPVNLLRGANT